MSHTVAIGVASEQDNTACDLLAVNETDSAISIHLFKSHRIGVATETDTAITLGISAPSNIVVAVGTAMETDAAMFIGSPPTSGGRWS